MPDPVAPHPPWGRSPPPSPAWTGLGAAALICSGQRGGALLPVACFLPSTREAVRGGAARSTSANTPRIRHIRCTRRTGQRQAEAPALLPSTALGRRAALTHGGDDDGPLPEAQGGERAEPERSWGWGGVRSRAGCGGFVVGWGDDALRGRENGGRCSDPCRYPPRTPAAGLHRRLLDQQVQGEAVCGVALACTPHGCCCLPAGRSRTAPRPRAELLPNPACGRT